jgi:branched-chain amino acid transport system substrate-binding protein
MFGTPIEFLTADPQNKPDTAASIVRKWYENDGVDMIIDMPTSATALAGMELSKQFEKIMIVTDAASSDITGKSCSPYTAHWTYDTYANAHTVGGAIVKNGGDSWFFITADYVFGHSIERDTGEVVKAAGGKVVGSVKHPLNTPDFSSYLLQAQSSKAKIIGLANGGGDTINAIKQAGEFGIVSGGQNLAAIVMFISDVHSLGLKLAQGLIITEAYYWDLNDKTRAFGKRFFERMKRMPTMNQAATYSATLHYLKAVRAAGTSASRWRTNTTAGRASGSVVEEWVSFLRFSPWKSRSALRPWLWSSPFPAGGPPPSFGTKLFMLAQASISVPSTEK